MGTSRYTEEFKAEAVGQVIDRGYSVREVAERIGVSAHSLYKWMKEDRRNPGSAKAKKSAGLPISI
jgi:transposase